MLFRNRTSSGGVQWLLVCLGNPGDRFEGTRHNAGFQVADVLSARYHVPVNKLKNRALTGVIEAYPEWLKISFDGRYRGDMKEIFRQRLIF